MAEVQAENGAGGQRQIRFRDVAFRVLIAIPLTFAGLSLWWHLHPELSSDKYQALSDRLFVIERAVEEYEIDHGYFPARIDSLILEGYLDAWPENPFAAGELMKPLQPSDDWEPGGFVYVAWGPALALLPGQQLADDFDPRTSRVPWQDTLGNTYEVKLGVDRRPELPYEYWEHLLLAYGPKGTVEPADVRFWMRPIRRGTQVVDNLPVNWNHVAAFNH